MTDTGAPIVTRVEPVHEHIYDARWYPLDRKHVRRVCVLPGCSHREVMEAKT